MQKISLKTLIIFQLFNTQELEKYNIWLNNLQKTTALTLNAVAVALLNKVSLMPRKGSTKFNQFWYVFIGCISVFYGLQVFNWRVVDCDLAIGLCTLLSKAEVYKVLWKVIDNTWKNYDKILVGNMITNLLYFIVTDKGLIQVLESH